MIMQDNFLPLSIILLSLALSCFFSGTETAFLTVNKVRVEVWRRRKERIASIIYPFLEHPEKFLYTTLIGNNIFNVAFATVATVYFNNYLAEQVTWLMIVLLTIFIGEIIPKTVFRSLADWIVRLIALPLQAFYYLFLPITWIISRLSEMILSLLGYKKGDMLLFFSEKDIKILLSRGEKIFDGEDTPVEGDVLSGILSLKDLWVREAMVPRTEMIAVPEDMPLEAVKEIFFKHGHTKLPVFRDTFHNIIGVVFLKDLFQEPAELKDIIRDVLMVPETKRCSSLLSELRENNISIAVVIDEYGGTAGLITTEDLVEELFGDIKDEHDNHEIMIRPLDEKTFRVNARIEIDQLNEELGLQIPEGDYETLAGFLISQTGSILRRVDKFEYNGVKMTVTSATRRKIQWLKITLP